MKAIAIFRMLTAATIALQPNARDKKQNNTDVFCEIKPDGWECRICGQDYSLEVHHIIPRKNGGNHNADNLITLCNGCHRIIEMSDIDKAIEKCTKRFLSPNLYSIKNKVDNCQDLKGDLEGLFHFINRELEDSGSKYEVLRKIDELLFMHS